MSDRYSRQIAFSEVGVEGQQKIEGSKVAVVGVGALGSVHVDLLARAGVGSLVLIDKDLVEESNLQRQALFTEKHVGLPKAAVAEIAVKEINSEVKVTSFVKELNESNVSELLKGVDLVLDGSDNMETRLVLDKYCRKAGVPCVFGLAAGSEGFVLMFVPGKSTGCEEVFPSGTSGSGFFWYGLGGLVLLT